MSRKEKVSSLAWSTSRRGVFVLFSICLILPLSFAQKAGLPPKISIVPKPAKIEIGSGFFRMDQNTKIAADAKPEEALAVAEDLASKLRQSTGYPINILRTSGKTHKNALLFKLSSGLSRLGREGYLLSAKRDGVTVEAFSPAGLFYGAQTLLQLLPPEIAKSEPVAGISWTIPCVKIEDKPRFKWRGVHLDVGRHFFPKEFIKKYIDLLAMYKMNTFHWHLTEDQGWRIEIKKYPKLAEVGAWRKETMDDDRPHGGFYTQDEIREVVDYAKKRFITVVPEIEMPGHSQAALASYPELSCSGGPFKVNTEFGVINDVYCAGNEKTFEFLEDVLSEVIDLFPGEFVHIGGDEVPKLRWQNCLKCQERIKTEGLASEEELQSYFIQRIERFLNAKGKRLIGWDEILEGGLAPNAAVMSWRGVAGGIEAARSGHDVVMSPTSYCYFDYYQALANEPKAIGGFLPIDKVYSYEPLPAELTLQEAAHILGAQANIWTEYMPNTQQVEYMLMPRMLALSEVVWTKKELRNFHDFLQRLTPHYERLAAAEINFRLPPPDGFGGRKVIFSPVQAKLDPPFPQAEMHYTTDGSDPTRESPLYSQPIDVETSMIVRARTFLPSGRASRTASTVFSLIDPDKNGLEFAYFEGMWNLLPDLQILTPLRTGRAYDISFEHVGPGQNNFAVLLKGFIHIPTAGEYVFSMISDGGALLAIGDGEVVRNDGWFPTRELNGSIKLEPGAYPIKISYFQKSWGRRLEITCEGPGMRKEALPPHWLFIKTEN